MLELIRNLYAYRELIASLVKRDLAARYKQSLLGPAWAVLQPLTLMVLFTVIRSFVEIPSEGLPYPLFVFAALLPWTFFSNSIVFATPSIVLNAGIVRKIYFPREVFPTAAVAVTLIDFAAAFVVLLGLMAFYRVVPSPFLFLLPLLLLIQCGLSLGVGYITAALGAFKRDVAFGMPFVMQFWLYISPVIYPLSSVPERYRPLYLMNPMAGLIEAYRAVLVKGQLPDLAPVGYAAVGSALILVGGYRAFKALEMQFADVV